MLIKHNLIKKLYKGDKMKYIIKKYYMLVIGCFISIIISLAISNISLIPKDTPKAENGVLDLTHWNFEKDGMLQLSGEWEFYWEQLLTYNDFRKNNTYMNGYQNVPDTWDGYSINNENNQHPTDKGYATYRIKVKTGYYQKPLALKILTMSTSYKLMVDDSVIATNGIVSDNEKDTKPMYKPQTVSIIPKSNEFEIIIQVSNFTYARGGIWRPIILGLDSDIRKLSDRTSRSEMLVFGVMFIMMCYHFILYCVRREDKSLIYAVGGLFFTLLRIIVTGEYYITTLFENMPFELLILLEYGTLYLGLLFWVLFVGQLFPLEFNKNIIRVFTIISICFTMLAIILPIYIYTNHLIYIEIYLVILILYTLFNVIMAIYHNQDDAKLIFYCCILMLTAFIIDVFIFWNYISNNTGGVFTASVGLIVLLQSIIISRRYSRAMEQSKLSEVAMLQAQISPHFLHNAMNALAELSYEGGDKAYDAITSFSDYLRYSYDLSHQSKFITLSKEIELVNAYLEVEKLRYGDKLQYNISVENSKIVYMPPFIIQPLVENAVRHGISKKEGGGFISVTGKQKDKVYEVIIKDSGVGISQEIIDKVLIGEKTDKMGQGLSNVNKRLLNVYKKGLNITINDEKGTTISFSIKLGGKYDKDNNSR
jgi:sensor histidine kinase YesM